MKVLLLVWLKKKKRNQNGNIVGKFVVAKKKIMWTEWRTRIKENDVKRVKIVEIYFWVEEWDQFLASHCENRSVKSHTRWMDMVLFINSGKWEFFDTLVKRDMKRINIANFVTRILFLNIKENIIKACWIPENFRSLSNRIPVNGNFDEKFSRNLEFLAPLHSKFWSKIFQLEMPSLVD